MDLKRHLPNREDVEVIAKTLGITLLLPISLLLIVIGTIFSWAILTVLLLIIGSALAIIVLLLLVGLIQALFFEFSRKR